MALWCELPGPGSDPAMRNVRLPGSGMMGGGLFDRNTDAVVLKGAASRQAKIDQSRIHEAAPR